MDKANPSLVYASWKTHTALWELFQTTDEVEELEVQEKKKVCMGKENKLLLIFSIYSSSNELLSIHGLDLGFLIFLEV